MCHESAEGVLFGDIWIQDVELGEVIDPLGQSTDLEVLSTERLQIPDLFLSCTNNIYLRFAYKEPDTLSANVKLLH